MPASREFVFDDPARTSSVSFVIPTEASPVRTLGDVLSFYRSADFQAHGSTLSTDPRQRLERARYAERLFLLTDAGSLGELIPELQFKIGGRTRSLEQPLEDEGPIRIDVDRSRTGYVRNWPAYLSRHWKLRAHTYSTFVESLVEQAYGPEAPSILRLDSPDRVRRFLDAVGRRIHAAPYETYSRYLDPCTPFKSCDQTLDGILEGNGGICAEKAMAFYFIAHAYGLQPEIVLGGENAGGSFPYGILRSILNQHTFDFAGSDEAQRYWQHYAILCRPPRDVEEQIFCDVAGSNIPFLCLSAEEAAPFFEPMPRKAIEVTITLEPIRLYYHRLAHRQNLPLDLYYAMEHFIESIDVIQTVDNELGLLHTGDYWVGAIAYEGRRELARITDGYASFVGRAGLDPRADVCFAEDLYSARHPLLERFRQAYSDEVGRLAAAHAGLRQRIKSANSRLELRYVVIALKTESARSE